MAFAGTGKIWMNGKMVDWKDATIHVASHVIHYGTGAFEGATGSGSFSAQSFVFGGSSGSIQGSFTVP